MKLTIISILLFSKFFCINIDAGTKPNEDKLYKVSLPLTSWNYIMKDLMDKPMKESEPIVIPIREQIYPQLSDTSQIKK